MRCNLFLVDYICLSWSSAISQSFGNSQSNIVHDGDFDILCIAITQPGRYGLQLTSGGTMYAGYNQIDYFRCYGQVYRVVDAASGFTQNIDSSDPSLFQALKNLGTSLPPFELVRDGDLDHFDLVANALKARRFDGFPSDSLPLLYLKKRSDEFNVQIKVVPDFFALKQDSTGARVAKLTNNLRKQPVLKSAVDTSLIKAITTAFPDIESTVVSNIQSSLH